MDIKLNNQIYTVKEELLLGIKSSKELLTILNDFSGNSYDRTVKSIKDFDIERIKFGNYREFAHVKRYSNEIFDSSTEVIIGGNGDKENTWTIEVDKIQNVLLNISEYKLHDLDSVGIKTYVFNAKLNTIANYFNMNASDSINLNVRDDIALMNFKRDSMDFLETMKSNKNNFYLYNGGITIITASDISITSDETIKIFQPKVINGAQTISRYIYYKLIELRQELSYEDGIEIPLKLMVVSEGGRSFFDDIAMDISLKINSHNAVTTDNLNYLQVKKLGLINKYYGLDIKGNKDSMREYQKLYTNLIMGRPGTAKSGMANLIQNCVDNYMTLSSGISLNEKNEKNIIFTTPDTKIFLDESVNFLWYFDDSRDDVISEIDFHHKISKYIKPEYENVMNKIVTADISPKYNQYITGIYFALISEYIRRTPRIVYERDLENILFNKACKLVINVTPEVIKGILLALRKFFDYKEIKNQINVPTIELDGVSKRTHKYLNIEIFEEKYSKLIFIESLWKKYNSSENDSVESFAKDYTYSAHTFKTDELFNFYKKIIKGVNNEVLSSNQNVNFLVEVVLYELGISIDILYEENK